MTQGAGLKDQIVQTPPRKHWSRDLYNNDTRVPGVKLLVAEFRHKELGGTREQLLGSKNPG